MHRVSKLVDQFQPSSPSSDLESKQCGNDSFEYTLAGSLLSNEQRRFYEENGFLVIRGLLNSEEVSKYYNRFDELVANPKERPPNMILMRDVALSGLEVKDRKSERVVTKLQNWSQDRVLWTYAKHPRIIPYIKDILGYDIRAHHFMSINKPADPGALSSRHPLHQDQWYFPFAPSKYIACSWTALQKVNRNNGCLVVIPGTHRYRKDLHIGGKLLAHAYPKPWHGPVNKAYHGIQVDDGMINRLLSQRVHLEMEPGDTVFFHPLLFHGSGANLTGKNRRSISVHYCNSKKVDFIKGGVIPEQSRISKEVEQMALRTRGLSVTFEQIWKAKSRQVQGDAASFKF
eukprot:CAMPEP_0197073948 /NCGR_PEP_ID=MMETSP1384-20130603/210864_1 /TAXON_ID=29189 /ORGANISM="Ammonia sp." /LENGTH=343 /DNA_ID=CAMNT_0042512789 /DNA_START=23 /DNA_END=1054 /DNA_ORIENTATION=+